MIAENTPAIETPRLFLRKFTEADATAYYEIMRDEEVNTFLPWFPVQCLEEAKAGLQSRFLSHYDAPVAFRYAVCLKADNVPIGYVCLGNGESHDFGYGLRKEHWHQGIITEAALAVVEKIKAAGYRYITATHDVNNPRSGEVMKKIGMTYRYSYVEQWQPKNFPVVFRLYQRNFDGHHEETYMRYWQESENHFIETLT